MDGQTDRDGRTPPAETPESRRKLRRQIALLAAFVVGGFALIAAAGAISRPILYGPNIEPEKDVRRLQPEVPEELTPDWFNEPDPRIEDEPWLRAVTAAVLDEEGWHCSLRLTEAGGRPFRMDGVEEYLFTGDGKGTPLAPAVVPAALPGGGAWELRRELPRGQILGLGFLIRGQDDAGRPLIFRAWCQVGDAAR